MSERDGYQWCRAASDAIGRHVTTHYDVATMPFDDFVSWATAQQILNACSEVARTEQNLNELLGKVNSGERP